MKLYKIYKYFVLAIITIVLLFPIYFMIKGSFENIIGIMAFPPNLIPKKIIFDNYNWFFENAKMLKYIANTFIISISSVLLVITVTALSGYAFSFYEFKGKKIIFWAFMISIMIPGQALLISKYVICKEFGILNSYWSVILPNAFSAVYIFIFKTFCDNIPRDLIDSARIDGASESVILFRIVLPMCKSAIGCIAIFGFIGSLTNYLWQMLVLKKEDLWTLVVGVIYNIMSRSNAEINQIGIQLAGGVILFIPVLIVFCIFSRYFIKGINTGAIKG